MTTNPEPEATEIPEFIAPIDSTFSHREESSADKEEDWLWLDITDVVAGYPPPSAPDVVDRSVITMPGR